MPAYQHLRTRAWCGGCALARARKPCHAIFRHTSTRVTCDHAFEVTAFNTWHFLPRAWGAQPRRHSNACAVFSSAVCHSKHSCAHETWLMHMRLCHNNRCPRSSCRPSGSRSPVKSPSLARCLCVAASAQASRRRNAASRHRNALAA